jgi:hypothetical protein
VKEIERELAFAQKIEFFRDGRFFALLAKREWMDFISGSAYSATIILTFLGNSAIASISRAMGLASQLAKLDFGNCK